MRNPYEDYYPEYRVLGETKPIASKEHTSCYGWCNKPINKGERYRKAIYISTDRKFYCDRYHLRHAWGET